MMQHLPHSLQTQLLLLLLLLRQWQRQERQLRAED